MYESYSEYLKRVGGDDNTKQKVNAENEEKSGEDLFNIYFLDKILGDTKSDSKK